MCLILLQKKNNAYDWRSVIFPLAEKLLENSVVENIETAFLKIYRILSKINIFQFIHNHFLSNSSKLKLPDTREKNKIKVDKCKTQAKTKRNNCIKVTE